MREIANDPDGFRAALGPPATAAAGRERFGLGVPRRAPTVNAEQVDEATAEETTAEAEHPVVRSEQVEAPRTE